MSQSKSDNIDPNAFQLRVAKHRPILFLDGTNTAAIKFWTLSAATVASLIDQDEPNPKYFN
jgi:hypothetical protein